MAEQTIGILIAGALLIHRIRQSLDFRKPALSMPFLMLRPGSQYQVLEEAGAKPVLQFVGKGGG
jgi:hypothetical protein